ncbi:MAG: hypothetical protein U5N86_02445 [Planctomycetota bacterium]|nr:hypothetical protein [Planctomycetota bacterium]
MKKEKTEKMLEEFRPVEPRDPEKLRNKVMADFDKQTSKGMRIGTLVTILRCGRLPCWYLSSEQRRCLCSAFGISIP